jgi:hypothetical protein
VLQRQRPWPTACSLIKALRLVTARGAAAHSRAGSGFGRHGSPVCSKKTNVPSRTGSTAAPPASAACSGSGPRARARPPGRARPGGAAPRAAEFQSTRGGRPRVVCPSKRLPVKETCHLRKRLPVVASPRWEPGRRGFVGARGWRPEAPHAGVATRATVSYTSPLATHLTAVNAANTPLTTIRSSRLTAVRTHADV